MRTRDEGKVSVQETPEYGLIDAIESASEAFVIWDAEDRMVFCNSRYKSFFAEPEKVCPGVRFDSLVEMNIAHTSVAEISLLPAGWDPDQYRRARLDCHNLARDTFIQLRDGRWLQSCERRTREGGVVGVYTDITERKRAEEALAASKRAAEEANLAKSRFLAAASHDLRQPLHAVGILVSALSARLEDERQKEIAGQIGDCLETVSSLFDALLDISKLDAGVVAPAFAPVPLGPLLKALRREFTPLAERKGLRLTVLDSRLAVRSDAAMLGRILRNFLSNAIKYTESGGVLLGVRRRGESLRIDVIDNGPGFDPAEAEAVFREFHRLEGTAAQQGIGLGLSIADRLARLLEHRLEVATQPGAGARFSLHAAPAEAPTAAAVPMQTPRRVLSGRRLLLIDDDPEIRRAALLLFEGWGCHCAAASGLEDAAAALACLDGPPEAMIVDYHLKHGRTGDWVAARITENLGAPVPTVMVTGETAPELLQKVQGLGFPVLHKPLQPMRLRAVLQHLLG
ncbi:MAG: PAS-domain containing protein [Alphaproteobacteria bacterium]|nr:PAS-domain containing protein [Alphaproteobacteria bacterium]MBU0796915.1 PAS-domain containing protein [Alphaproteobacteria bacterium]MBU0886441.1 PAS-domain containing protein [Alphaproteobacteria bacterium]MBU1812336.1 PAS-domain containing protein [Alphaproteobacteria bacterium]